MAKPNSNYGHRPSAKKNEDLLKLLMTSSLFQNIVRDARKILGIPEDKPFNDNKALQNWSEALDQEAADQMLSPVFWEQLEKIEGDKKARLITEEMADEQSKLLHRQKGWNFLKHTADFVIEKFNLPLHYIEPIKTYIMTGKISFPLNNFAVGPYPVEEGRPIKDRKYLPITIYAKLTKKDIEQLNKTIDGFFGKNLPKYDEIPTIDRLIKLDEWNKSKKKFDQVEQKAYKMSATEIAENVLNNSKSKQKVYDSGRQLKALRKKRFGTK